MHRLESNTMYRAVVDQFTGILTVLLMAMALLFAIVGGLSLMSTMSLNVLERTREIGVLRTIGASNSIVMRVIIIESVCVGLLSWFLAFLISLSLSKILSTMVGLVLFNNPWLHSFPLRNVLVWLVIAIVISVLASYLPVRNTSLLSVREALAYE